MTDRELLEAAAKTAGFDFSWDMRPMVRCYEPKFPLKTHNIWNPLTDDGDALRLAVKLNFVVASMRATHEKQAFTTVYHFNGPEYATEFHGNHPDEATRRAIVRAAAEMGKTK